jgi:peptide/nickel transport system permease protein
LPPDAGRKRARRALSGRRDHIRRQALCTWGLTALIPGNVAQTILGTRATPAALASFRAAYGLNAPPWDQYGRYLDRLAHGNLGYSLVLQQGVGQAIGQRAPATLLLVAYATVIALSLGIPLGLIAAHYRGGVVDHAIRVGVVAGLALPTFWVSVLMISLALLTHAFPVGGYGTTMPAHMWYLFLPAFALALTFLAVITRGLRASSLQVLASDFIVVARAKGVGPGRMMRRHVLRNAALPVLTLTGLNVAWLIGGTVVVETVFQVPGVGSLMVSSILARDFQVVQGLALMYAVFVVSVNVLTDLLYVALDPRVTVT